ncbi:MAG: transcriptional repressor [Syntrophomonadaceae bacterium]|nr:transcriptional repressor [Syntrophomonadaceae bacterium]
MDLEHIFKKIEKADYKLTHQRAAILDVMLNNKGRHLTAEEVFNKAKEKVPNIGIATVYRTLDKLASIEVLHKTMFFGDKYHYEVIGIEEHHHHHIICMSCNRIIEMEEDLLHNLEAELETRGFKILNHELKFYGCCPDCNHDD